MILAAFLCSVLSAVADPSNSIQLDSELTASYEVSSDLAAVTFTVTSNTSTWLALGVSIDGKMTSSGAGSDAVVCSDGTVKRYWLTTFAVDPTAGVEMNGASCSQKDGLSTMSFTRTFAASGSTTRAISATEATTFIFAHGTSTTVGFHAGLAGSVAWSITPPAPPSATPTTAAPSKAPTTTPTEAPTTTTPTDAPTTTPSEAPTAVPTKAPAATPAGECARAPDCGLLHRQPCVGGVCGACQPGYKAITGGDGGDARANTPCTRVCPAEEQCLSLHRRPCSEGSCGGCLPGYEAPQEQPGDAAAPTLPCVATCQPVQAFCASLRRLPCSDVPFTCGPCQAGYEPEQPANPTSACVGGQCSLDCSQLGRHPCPLAGEACGGCLPDHYAPANATAEQPCSPCPSEGCALLNQVCTSDPELCAGECQAGFLNAAPSPEPPQCEADCSIVQTLCPDLQRENCSDTPNTCGPCVSGFVDVPGRQLCQADCSQAPSSLCAERNRHACLVEPNTCGSPLQGYVLPAGDALAAVADCSAVPATTCEGMGRQPCSDTPNTCGACLPGSFASAALPAASNMPCEVSAVKLPFFAAVVGTPLAVTSVVSVLAKVKAPEDAQWWAPLLAGGYVSSSANNVLFAYNMWVQNRKDMALCSVLSQAAVVLLNLVMGIVLVLKEVRNNGRFRQWLESSGKSALGVTVALGSLNVEALLLTSCGLLDKLKAPWTDNARARIGYSGVVRVLGTAVHLVLKLLVALSQPGDVVTLLSLITSTLSLLSAGLQRGFAWYSHRRTTLAQQRAVQLEMETQ